MAKSVTDATAEVHAILEPLEPDERRRVIQAAMILLGDDAQAVSGAPTKAASSTGGNVPVVDTEDATALPNAAQRWMKKHKLDLENLEHFFHFDDGGVEPIELPGDAKAKREKTINTYLMQGVASLLQTGAPSFTDDDARNQCTEFGCYDRPNHGKYLKNFGNLITGSKSSGWKLTAPGLKAAAELLSPEED